MPTRKKRANLRDVAKAAEVSVATVSRVINDASSVRPATRKRVEDAIDTLNFVPSAAARAINSGRTRIVGALVPTLDHAIYSRFLDALEQGLAVHGLSLVVATTDEESQRELDRAKGLLDLGVEGFIVSGVTHSAEFEALVAKRDLPVVVTSYYDPDYLLPTVGYDNWAVGKMALTHLAAQGYERVAVLHGPSDSNDRTRARLKGVRRAATGPLTVRACSLRMESAAAAVRDVFNTDPKIDAVLCLSDVLAQGALFECLRMGLRVPDDIAIMGVDDLPTSAHVAPGLTTVHLPVRQMGQHAAEALAQWVETGRRPGSSLLPVRIIERQTTH